MTTLPPPAVRDLPVRTCDMHPIGTLVKVATLWHICTFGDGSEVTLCDDCYRRLRDAGELEPK